MKKTESFFEEEMRDPEFKKLFYEAEKTLDIEIQFLKALKEKEITYEEFAEKLGTKRSNVCRDLKGKAIQRASLHRIRRMANALDMELIIKLIPRADSKKQLESQHL